MNNPYVSISGGAWDLIGWTMLHFLWLGCLLGVAAVVCRVLFHRASPNSRYAASLSCLLLTAALPLVIVFWLRSTDEPLPRLGRNTAMAVTAADVAEHTINKLPNGEDNSIAHQGIVKVNSDVAAAESQSAGTTIIHEWIAPLLVLGAEYLPWLWIVGAPIMLVLVVTGAIGGEKLRKSSSVIVEGPIFDAGVRLSRMLQMQRPTAVAFCENIAAPMLIGIIRPIIILPATAFTSWTTEEIDMVLIHELAHVRRWDNLINLLQRLIEATLFFHPVIWLLSSWVRREREACCDAEVVGNTNRPQAYAELLVALASQLPRSVLFHPAASNALAVC